MDNNRTKSMLEDDIKTTILKFLSHHLGEKVASISIVLKFEMLDIFAFKCLPPAEQNLTDKPMLFKLLQEVKSKQFELQKSFLKAQIEKIIGCTIEDIESCIFTSGIRIIHISLSGNFEKDLIKIE